jgi:hypothetical protein
MCATFRRATRSNHAYAGFHQCNCGAGSASCDYHLAGGELTNSLCVHYVAHHRVEIPPSDLARIERFALDAADPTDDELQGPQFLLAGTRTSIERKLGIDRLSVWVAWGLDLDTFSETMRGGSSPDPEVSAHVQKKSHELMSILCGISHEALPYVEDAVRRRHHDMGNWAAVALGVLRWKRENWIPLLGDLVELPDEVLKHRCYVRYLRDRLLEAE